MSRVSLRSSIEESVAKQQACVRRGSEVIRAEMAALDAVAAGLGESFYQAVEMLLGCQGAVVVCGMGKAGLIGKKLAASFSSTGTPSYFLHPAEAVHGDLGSVRNQDLILFLSYSGETEEVTRLLPLIDALSIRSLAITSHNQSTLARGVDLTLVVGQHSEACSLGLAPSCSTTAMLALGDALALVVSEQRGFSSEDFARFHPAGNLGRQLTKVDEVMRPLVECRVAEHSQTVRQVLIQVGRPGRRTGAVMLVDEAGKLVGIFTDSDLARLLEKTQGSLLDQPICQLMTRRFQTISSGCYLPEAMRLLAQRKISELPVVGNDLAPLGIIDITDVMSVMSDSWVVAKQEIAQGNHVTHGPDEEPMILPLNGWSPTSGTRLPADARPKK